MPLDIIFLAVIAAVIAFKLYKILGQSGEDDPAAKMAKFMKPGMFTQDPIDNVIPIVGNSSTAEQVPFHENQEIASVLAAINFIDRSLTPQKFIDGARKAFEIILRAYASGDKETLQSLLSPQVLSDFSSSIDERAAHGEKMQTTLVAMPTSEITAATLNGRIATITVRFVTEQINVIRDKDGTIISGDDSTIEHGEDHWTFTRNLESSNLNWQLTATHHD